jgi:hypothetical protein
MQWWFCLIHQAVESGAGCPDESRLGPYESKYLADTAIQRMKSRNDDLDAKDDD